MKSNKTTNKELITSCNKLDKPQNIENLILSIRETPVIIDRDLAQLYGVETKALNQAVKRNIARFPERYMFQLTDNELDKVVTNCDHLSKLKFSPVKPYAFTEQGISMLSAVLRSKTAVEVSIRIMDAFVAMRHFLLENAALFQRLKHLELKQIADSKRIDEVFEKLDMNNVATKQHLFFNGQIFDAYVFMSDLIRQAKKEIILIDNYIDETVLTILDKRNKDVKATIYTSHYSEKLKLDLLKHNSQYPSIQIECFNQSHDRFIIIDDDVYLIGASIKDLGKKWFVISELHFSKSEIISRL